MFWLTPAIQLRQIDKVIMDVQVASAPHLEEKDAKSFITDLTTRRKQFGGIEQDDREFDRSKVEQLRQALKTRRLGQT